MIFNKYSNLVGMHAFLGASKYSWTNYDDEKLDKTYLTSMAAQRGTELHAFAAEAIRLGIKLPRTGETLNRFVNDALGYRMTPEQVLFVSENAFGTADAISFRRNKLRIHDLKTGVTPASVRQLEIYAAFFCLEYKFKPTAIDIEMRIYQNDEVQIFEADPDVITHIMDKTITFDKRINELRKVELS
jgi:hypothetical protein